MKYKTILADPPWRFNNRTTKASPEHERLYRYETMTINDIVSMDIASLVDDNSHLYLWVPNALLAEGLQVMKAWGFEYKCNIVWLKIAKNGEPDGRGMGWYFRNTTELMLFGIRGKLRTSSRTQKNIIKSIKREHSRKPKEQYDLIELCSPGPYLELFARHRRKDWDAWGNEVDLHVQS